MAKAAQPHGVRWGLMDRALALVAPGTAARRYAARISIDNLRRGYEGASRGRGTDGWKTANTSADAEIGAAGAILRDRMRDLVRNNPLAGQAVQVLVNNIVGTGIRPRAVSDDKALNKRVDELFEAWSMGRSDAHGHTDFYGLQVLAVREMLEGGDAFALKRPLRGSNGGVPLQIELREADHLDASKFRDDPQGSRIKQGIEYDRNGRRAAYWMFPDHPGDDSPVFSRRLESVRVPADMVAHLFERQRVQSRGVPWGTPALKALRDLDDWQVAEMVRKKTEACLVGIVFGDDEDQMRVAPTVQDSEGRQIEQFEPGLIAYARGGKDIKFNQPSATPGIREWNLVQMHIIAAGFRVPYALMTGDLSQANFSSSRAGLNEFRRMIEQVQWQIVIPMLCERIWGWFIDAAYTAGLIDRPDVPVEWAPPRFESVNPWQDAQTDLLEVRAGFASTPQMIAKRGWDPLAVVEEQAEFVKETDRLELVFDSDPRKVTGAGLAQAKDPLEPSAAPSYPSQGGGAK